MEWHSVLLPRRGTDRFYVYQGKGEAEHTAITRGNKTTRQWVLNELRGVSYFNPVQKSRVAGKQAFTRTWTVASGSTVLLEFDHDPLDLNAPTRSLLLRVSSSGTAGGWAWVFLERTDGAVLVEPIAQEQEHTHFWAGNPREYRRIGVMTPHPLPGTKLPSVQVSAKYDSGEAMEEAIRQAGDRYEVRISQLDVSRYPVITAYVSVRDKFSGPLGDLGAADFWVETGHADCQLSGAAGIGALRTQG